KGPIAMRLGLLESVTQLNSHALSKTARYSCDEDEVIEVLFLTPQELERKIVFGDITDSKTIACLSKAKLCGYL
ncbi:TPA: ADP-ribose pyrophosphatase, partial [Vibrio cholerae]